MSVDIKSMFESIKDSLKDEPKNGGGGFRNILRLQQGNSYLVRLIPNITEPKSTFFHYFHHGWTSNATGQYVDKICPTTFGDRCPICEERFKLYKKGSERDKDLARQIRRLEKHLVNVYVVDDPTNEENNGSTKILRFGVRIKEKFDMAIEGDDADEFGAKVFDLTDNGCNFKIKVESSSEGNRKFTNYNNSRFTGSGAIPGLTPDGIQEIYEGTFDLTEQIEGSTTDDLKAMLKTHLYEDNTEESGGVDDAVAEAVKAVTEQAEEPPKPKKKTPKASASAGGDNDDKIKDLLAGLDEVE